MALRIQLLIWAFIFLTFASESSAGPAKIIISEFAITAGEDMREIQAGIAALLPARIAVADKILIADIDAQAAVQLRQLQAAPLAQRCALAKKMGADYLVTGSITKLGRMISIDAQLLDAQRCSDPDAFSVQCAGVDLLIPEISRLGQSLRGKIEENPGYDSYISARADAVYAGQKKRQPPSSGAPRMAQQDRPGALFAARPIAADFIRSIPLQCLAAGDLNGDGVTELAAAGGNEIHVLAVDGGGLVKIEELQAPTDGSIVRIDAADLNGRAPDEIYVSSFGTRSADSSVFEYSDRRFAITQSGQPWFFRILDRPGGPRTLIGQDAHLNNPFAGKMHSLSWANGALAAGTRYSVPGGLNIYGFTRSDISPGAFLMFTASLFVPEYALQMINSEGKQVWRDSQSLGGTPNFFMKKMFADQTEIREPVPLRVLYEAGTAHHKPCIIVGRNVKKGQKIIKELINYNQGEVLCLVWNGSDFEINWRSGYVSGYVADYITADVDGDGTSELCVLSSTGDSGANKAVNKITIYRRLTYEN